MPRSPTPRPMPRPAPDRRAECRRPTFGSRRKTLCIFSKPTSPCSSSSLREVSVDAANAHQTSAPKARPAAPASAITVTPAAIVVRHCAAANSATGIRSRIAACRRAVRTGCRQAIGRCGNASSAAPSNAAVRKPFWPWPRLMKTAGKAAATGSQSRAITAARRTAQDRGDDGEIKRKARGLPHDRARDRAARQRDRESKKIGGYSQL